jgi:hypothetical protein
MLKHAQIVISFLHNPTALTINGILEKNKKAHRSAVRRMMGSYSNVENNLQIYNELDVFIKRCMLNLRNHFLKNARQHFPA